MPDQYQSLIDVRIGKVHAVHEGLPRGDAVIDIMRTHPMIIIGGILQHNPFFVPLEEFLREVRERRARRSTCA